MTITHKVVFITEDGNQHDTRDQAEQHERDIGTLDRLKLAIKAIGDSGMSEDDRGNAVLYDYDIASWIFLNRVQIRDALREI